jgi:hypothetical protein
MLYPALPDKSNPIIRTTIYGIYRPTIERSPGVIKHNFRCIIIHIDDVGGHLVVQASKGIKLL